MRILAIKPAGESTRKVTLLVDVSAAQLVRQTARVENKSVSQLVTDMLDLWIEQTHPDWEVVKDKGPKARKKVAGK